MVPNEGFTGFGRCTLWWNVESKDDVVGKGPEFHWLGDGRWTGKISV